MEVVIEEEEPSQRRLPEFDAGFHDTLSPCYFHHVIDPTAATLRVEVLGPNLAYTFRHDRAKELRLASSNITARLEAKVTGFLALKTGNGQQRVVLAWAQSGHGVGSKGDLLDADPNVLPNDLWTKRAISIGRALALRMRRPYDGRLLQTTGIRMEGVYLGSHVEVKLASYAISILLTRFGITQDLDNISLRDLTALREASWKDGSKPSFEIYFSRKNCNFCGKFRERLVKKVYEKKDLPKRDRQRQRQPQEVIQIDIADAETAIITDDVCIIETIDLSDDLPTLAELVNLTRGDTHDATNNNNNNIIITNSSNTSTIDLVTTEQELPTRAVTDTFIEGLAYCVGQIDECPAGARDAIVRLAAHNRRRENINKPLPATPQMAPPGYHSAASSPEPADDHQQGAPLNEAAVVNGGNLLTPPNEAAVVNAGNLLTPPSSGRRARVSVSPPESTRKSYNLRSQTTTPRALQQQQPITPSRPPRENRPVLLPPPPPRKSSIINKDTTAVKKEAREARLASLRPNAGYRRTRRVSFCVAIPAAPRRRSESPDPF
ncbi:hypothetical protein BBK36DRAFT_1159522 [Trichoderma citrinoviride]|uniref:Uncharacterized protein n=1 Tax=Trichoderma citrinoviride TaxID=58853 RepID=A0A2T4BB96_9HYPO|nr:hypothetical protein BBK36DRAFT_1159522 [Trichoderma citrinoviride]PTB66489.1 hypothetical protein BBK36DRAFT_1159522 [Trichoderma citrinoviride]